MNNRIFIVLNLFFFIFNFICCGRNHGSSINTNEMDNTEIDLIRENKISLNFNDTLPLGYTAMKESYPEFIDRFENNRVYFKDGSFIIYDDEEEKDFNTLLDNSSLKDMFYTEYIISDSLPNYLSDAGRSRNEEFFKKVYGKNAEEVSKKLTKIDWFGQMLPFTTVNDEAKQLNRVAEELSAFPQYKEYLKSAGTYYWRKVRGANRLSAHSYGIAIDLGVNYSNYWKWDHPNAKEEDRISYKNRFPKKIVERSIVV